MYKQITIKTLHNQGEQIALHQRINGSIGNFVTVRSHLPDYKVYSQTEYQARYEAKMADIGEYAISILPCF